MKDIELKESEFDEFIRFFVQNLITFIEYCNEVNFISSQRIFYGAQTRVKQYTCTQFFENFFQNFFPSLKIIFLTK
jgi:hypothetical protein